MEGLIFKDEEVLNYYLSLKTKPFVILMGLSGSGKTKLALEFAKALSEKSDQYVLVPVEAGWIDNKSLLGYYNPLTDCYSSTPFLELILRAHQNFVESIIEGKNPKPYFIILDEMNISKVEYYFSKFLSILETMDLKTVYLITNEPDTPILENDKEMLLSEPLDLHYEQKLVRKHESGKNIPLNKVDLNNKDFDYYIKNGDYIPPKIRIPPNIYFTGTVNVDETTYIFSPKVLDRANSIELININLKKFQDLLTHEKSLSASSEDKINLKSLLNNFTYEGKFYLNSDLLSKKIDIYKERIEKFFAIIRELKQDISKNASKFNFGYRVISEMIVYIINALDLLGNTEDIFIFAMNYQLKQKILSKIHGMKSELFDLFEEFKNKALYSQYSVFHKKIEEMYDELKSKQFTSYM